ncbi:MAG TPA: hypothetical protein VG184_10700 [Acidimicrobiales bacterium]|nr:hypothetical protein [Acidimicrobiales bacterium]
MRRSDLVGWLEQTTWVTHDIPERLATNGEAWRGTPVETLPLCDAMRWRPDPPEKADGGQRPFRGRDQPAHPPPRTRSGVRFIGPR